MPITIDRVFNIRRTDDTRSCAIYISNEGDTYLHYVGGIALEGDIATLLADKLDRLYADAQAKNRVIDVNEQLARLTKEDIITYIRQSLIDANGNGAAIQTLYTQARAYAQQNAQLTATLATYRTLHDVAQPLNTISLNSDQGKAQYLLYFVQAVALWS